MESNKSDYIIINNLDDSLLQYKINLNNLRRLADRSIGIGSNGIIFIEKSFLGDIKLDIYNSDGSKPNLNTNAIICAVEYLKNKIKKKKLNIEVNNKLISVEKNKKEITINDLEYDMSSKTIPVITEKNLYFNEQILIDRKKFNASGITVGNSHIIVNSNEIDYLDINYLGRKIQNNIIFPNKINIVFQKMVGDEITIRIYEIGNNETLSCGTAACATLIYLYYCGKIKLDKEYDINQIGGISKVTLNNNNKLKIKGKANYIYKGKI